MKYSDDVGMGDSSIGCTSAHKPAMLCFALPHGALPSGNSRCLHAAKPTFEYQSCTNLPLKDSGSMTGHFTFVEGSIANPASAEFYVQVRQRAELKIMPQVSLS